jgi:hypothetical protein
LDAPAPDDAAPVDARVIFDTKACFARSEAAALAACFDCFLGSLSALRLRGFLSLAPDVLAMTGADGHAARATKSRSKGREKAVKEEPKASRGSGESHQKPHQKLHQHRPKIARGFFPVLVEG